MAITPTVRSHDLTLGDGTTTLGLVQAKDKVGKKIPIELSFAQSLSPQQWQELSQASFPPNREVPLTIRSNHKGFGKQSYTQYRYNDAKNTDARIPEYVRPSPVPTATTNSNPTQTGYNMGFENWTSISSVNYPDNWASNSTANPCTRDASVVDAGTYSASALSSTAPFTIRQALGVTALLNTTIQITIRTNAPTGGDASLVTRILDASDTQLATQTDTMTAAAGWVTKTINYTFVGTVTNPILDITLTPGSTEPAYIDTLVITWGGTALTTLTPGTTVKAIDFNSAHYMISDTGVWKRTAANWTWVGGSPPGITDAFISADGTYLVLCRGLSLVYWLMRTNESFLICSSASGKIQHGCVNAASNYGNTSATQLTKIGSLETFASTTNYTGLGELTYAVNSVLPFVGLVHVVKEKGPIWYITSGGVVTAVDNDPLQYLYNTNTGKNAIVGPDATLNVPCGSTAGLMAFDSSYVPYPRGPSDKSLAERLSDYTGKIVGTASDGEWLFVCVDNGANIEILAGALLDANDPTTWLWHPIIQTAYTTVAWMHVPSVTAKQLYWGGGTALPKYVSLTGDSFATGGTWTSSWLDFGVPNVPKTFTVVTLDSVSLSATHQTIKVEYNKWGETSWTELGGSGNGTFSTSPSQTIAFASGVSSTRIQVRTTFTSDDTTKEFGVLALTIYAVVNAPRLEVVHMVVRVASDNIMPGTGAVDNDFTYKLVANKLNSWADTHPLTLTLPAGIDENGSAAGRSITCKFEETYPHETVLENGNIENPPRDPVSIFDLVLVQTRTS